MASLNNAWDDSSDAGAQGGRNRLAALNTRSNTNVDGVSLDVEMAVSVGICGPLDNENCLRSRLACTLLLDVSIASAGI